MKSVSGTEPAQVFQQIYIAMKLSVFGETLSVCLPILSVFGEPPQRAAAKHGLRIPEVLRIAGHNRRAPRG
jgi:hypothetical protein